MARRMCADEGGVRERLEKQKEGPRRGDLMVQAMISTPSPLTTYQTTPQPNPKTRISPEFRVGG
eukprot:1243307-Pyramimonas_sp.AAC.1